MTTICSERLDIPCVYPKVAGQVRPRPGTFAKKHRELAKEGKSTSSKSKTVLFSRVLELIVTINLVETPQPSRQISSGSSIMEDIETVSISQEARNHPSETPPDISNRSLLPPDSYLDRTRIPIGSLGPITVDDYTQGPSPLHPPGQGHIGGTTTPTARSIRQDFFSPHPDNKPLLDPNAHISSASHGPQRRLSENSLAPSHHSSIPSDHPSRLGPTLAPNPGPPSFFSHNSNSNSHSNGNLPTPLDYMQPTGHMLDHPGIETPVALDQTLVDFIKTMEQSESEWADFILSAGDSQYNYDHGQDHGHGHGHNPNHDHAMGGGHGQGQDGHSRMSNGQHGTPAATTSQNDGHRHGHVVAVGDEIGNDHRSGMDIDYRSNSQWKSYPGLCVTCDR
jgi:hypothetical protein